MRRLTIVIAMLVAVATFAAAQETPKVDVFAGYSLFHFDDQGLQDNLNTAFPGCCNFTKILHGWEGAVQYNINKTFGVVADFSGHYGPPIEVVGGPSVDAAAYNVLFGPQVNLRGKRFSGYAHTMLGFNRIRIDAIPAPVNSPTFTQTSFAWAIGGGLDLNASKLISIRLGQLDYILTTQDFNLPVSVGGHQNNLRYSAGVVFHLGSK